MSDDFETDPTREEPPPAKSAPPTLGGSTIFRLCEEVIALREMDKRQHKLFEQTQARARDELTTSFNSFAKATQEAYQKLRQEVHGEKRVSLALLNELLDLHMDLQHVLAARPPLDDAEALRKWAEVVDVQARKVGDAVRRHGIQEYDAVISAPYNPALHERVGSKRVEGMGPNLVAEQRERGYASQQPEFVLRRPKVIVTE